MLLTEVSVIRPLIIFLLVVYHALCPFTGGWAPPAGVGSNALYWWLGRLISGFRIETIAFIGGYVFCFQCCELGKRQPLHRFVWKKVRRLLIPCFLFGTLYYLLFRFNAARFSWYVAFWKVANGIGHLWFLPMLFWCFLAGWAVDRLLQWLVPKGGAWRWLPHLLLVLLAAVSLTRLHGLRMGLTRAPYFFFYFYLGYWLRGQSAGERPRLRIDGFKPALLFALLYLLCLLARLQATHVKLPGMPFVCPGWMRGWSALSLRLLAFGHTVCGILALYCAVSAWLRLRRPPDYQPGPRLRMASAYCYGTYVFHMFFMQPLYFFSPFPAWCSATAAGAWLFPWVSLVLALVPSLLVTALLLRTRWGRVMIG